MLEKPFDALTDDDKYLIEEYIKTWGPTHPGRIVRQPSPLSTVLGTWNSEKQTLFKMFGGKDLILRRPYAYTATESTMLDLFTKQAKKLKYTNFFDWYTTTIQKNYLDVVDTPTYYKLYIMPSSDVLCSNSWLEESFNFPLGDKIIKVSKGMKPMKVLAKIAEYYECKPSIFEDFRIWHSQLLNQKVLDGELCLSIHPLDFMTMSDNDDDWDSCMRWVNDSEEPGDYRAGTVEMMNSSNVIVAYLHNPEHTMDAELTDWEWNSKKWRELFIVQDGIISEVKGYPYQDEHLTNAVLMWLKELAHDNLGWSYDNEETNALSLVYLNELPYHITFVTDYMYNDIDAKYKLDEEHKGITRARINKKILPKYIVDSHVEITYGNTMSCLNCGRTNVSFKNNYVFCNECEIGYYCAHCGEWIEDEPVWIDDFDGPICEGCYEYETECDAFTEEVHMRHLMTEIYINLGEDADGRMIFTNQCIWVYEPKENEGFKQAFNIDEPRVCYPFLSNKIYYVTLDDMKDLDYVLYGLYDYYDIEGAKRHTWATFIDKDAAP